MLARLEPLQDRLRDLACNQDVSFRLIIIRYFNDEDGEEEVFEAAITQDGKLLERLPGQHQLLGWVLTLEQQGFLAPSRLAIWADEYG